MRLDIDERGRRILGEIAAGPHDAGWQGIACVVKQLGAGIAEKRAVHVEHVGESEGADAVARTRVDADQRWLEARRVATLAGLGRRDDRQMVGVGLPPETLGIQPLLQTEWTADPGLKSIGKSGPVVEFAPRQQAVGGVLERVTGLWVVELIVQTGADDRGNQVVQG